LNEHDVKRRVSLIRKLIPQNKRILEIGSGDGFFLESIKNYGYEAIGIEISSPRRKRSKKITNAKILDFDFSEGIPDISKVDAIVMFHVLEHINKPEQFLRNISKLLKSNGKMIAEVPNFDDFQNKTNRAYREWQFQKAHIHYFVPKILRNVFSRAGFKVKIFGVQRYSIENMISWKLTQKPQIKNPTFNISNDYHWIEKCYKEYLEKKLLSDTIIAVGAINLKN